MDQLNHYDYYVARAEACRSLARRAVSPAIAAIHLNLATMYETTAASIASAGGMAPSTDQVESDGSGA